MDILPVKYRNLTLTDNDNKVLEIIKNKWGKIIHFSDDAFDKSELRCKDNHLFEIYNNDILRDKWCQECETPVSSKNPIPDKEKEDYISTILQNLNIKYIFDEVYYIPKVNYILSPKKFSKEGWKVIIYPNERVEDENILQDQIWEAIRGNKEIDLRFAEQQDGSQKEKQNKNNIPNTSDNVNNICGLQENLYIANNGNSSIVKYAPLPYPPNKSLAFGYIRVSTNMQVKDGHSLEEQEEKIYRESKYRNLFLAKIFIDKGISGKDIEHRRSISRLMQDMKVGNICIITVSISRFGRRTIDTLSMVEELEKNNCKFISLDYNMDFTTPQGKMMLTIMASQAQFEREQTSERVKGTLRHLIEQGRHRSKPFFGWKLNPDRSPNAKLYIRDEEEQKVIEEIRRLRNIHAGYGITAFHRVICNALPPPRKSKEWYRKNLKDLMLREGIKIEKEILPDKDIDNFDDVRIGYK